MEEQIKNKDISKENETEVPLDKTVRLMSPTRMVVRRFFRSKLSIIGLIMVISLFLFSTSDDVKLIKSQLHALPLLPSVG